jgi:hypothetical protein
MLVDFEAAGTAAACEAVVEDVVMIAACESVDERTVGVSRRHPPSTAMAVIRGRNLTETFKRFVSA